MNDVQAYSGSAKICIVIITLKILRISSFDLKLHPRIVKYVMSSFKERNRIIKSEQIILQGCVIAHLTGITFLYLREKTVCCKNTTASGTTEG